MRNKMSKRPKSKPKGGKRLKRQHEAPEIDHDIAFNDLVNNPGLQHVVVEIFKNLDPQTLGRCRRVSKGWKSLIESDDRWWKLVLDVSRSNFYKIIEEEIPKGTFEMSCSDFFDGVEYIEKNGTLENVKLIAEFMMEYSTKILKKFKLKIFQKGWDTPLHYAACQNRLDIFEMFASIPKMTNMNLVNCDTDATILHNACMKGQVEIVEFFLNLTHDKKIDLERGYFGKRMEFEDSFGTKMFSLAYKSGHPEVVKLFMKHAEENKLDLYEPMDDARDRSENHLLRYLENKSTGVLKLILTDPKLDVNHTNWYDGQTALHHWFGKVAKTNGRLVLRIKDEEIMAIIEALLECPRIDLAKKDKKAFCVLGVYHFGKTALHIACKYKYPERIGKVGKFFSTFIFTIFSTFLEAYLKAAKKRGNIDVNQKDDLGKTAAHHALDYGNL